MKLWQGILLGTFLGLAFSAVIVMIAQTPRGDPIAIPPTSSPTPIIVYVSGAVKIPGLVSLSHEDRVSVAIDKAGGFTADADQTAVNLAAKLFDGDKIFVPARRELQTEVSANSNQAASGPRSAGIITPTPSFPININTATQQVLENLPNIGPSKASDIIQYRELHGPFNIIEDIQNVPNIGPVIFDSIKELISISG